MTFHVKGCAAAAIAFVFCAAIRPAHASLQPRWTDAQLVAFAAVIMTGRVVDVRVGTDPAVNAIYTYITLDVSRVLKGFVPSPQVIVKQLGGETRTRGLRVHGQAVFAIGEDLLLFLEARPRDRSLSPVAGWQGKWTLQQVDGVLTAVRQESESAIRSSWTIDVIDQLIERLGVSRAAAQPVNTHPFDAAAAVPRPYVLFDPPFRFNFSPFLDAQVGGQPGLTGGGFLEIFNAMTRWNHADSSFAFRAGSANGPARCYADELGNSRVTISFNDPCEEMSDSGGILAVGGAYYNPSRGVLVNGVFFYEATEGFIVNNNSPTALQFLRNANCFSDIQLHELGHVLGLDHSDEPAAVMYPTISGACAGGARGLGTDDVLGIRRIYPPGFGVTPPGTAPTSLAVAVNGSASITVTFDAVTTDVRFATSAATSYRLDFATTPTGPVLYAATTTATSVTIPIPAGLAGTFYVSVAGVNSAGPGPSSPRVPFTIEGCAPPPTPTGLNGRLAGSTASAAWNASAGATSYLVQAGSSPGAFDLANVDIGNATSVSVGGLSPGFRAYVRVIAVGRCGTSAPSADVLIQ